MEEDQLRIKLAYIWDANTINGGLIYCIMVLAQGLDEMVTDPMQVDML